MKGPQWNSLGNVVQKSTYANVAASGNQFCCPLGMGGSVQGSYLEWQKDQEHDSAGLLPLCSRARVVCYTAVCCSRGWMKGPQWNSLGNVVQKSTYANVAASGNQFCCPLGMGGSVQGSYLEWQKDQEHDSAGLLPLCSRARVVCYTAVCCSRGWMKGPQWNSLGNIVQKALMQIRPPLVTNLLALWYTAVCCLCEWM